MRSCACGEIHQDLVFGAFAGIRRQPHAFVGPVGIDALDEPDRADGDQVIRVVVVRVVFFLMMCATSRRLRSMSTLRASRSPCSQASRYLRSSASLSGRGKEPPGSGAASEMHCSSSASGYCTAFSALRFCLRLFYSAAASTLACHTIFRMCANVTQHCVDYWIKK